jgi:undecaprenyl-diphosphatase
MNKLDLFVQDYLISSRTSEFNGIFYFITSIFDVSVFFFLMTMVVIYFVHKIRGKNYSIFFLTNILVTMVLVYLLKSVFNTTRPVEGLVYAFGGSFPSYHATMSTVFFISLYYSFKEKLDGNYKRILYSVSILMVILVSFSRIYLGVHWLTDVIFGILLGGFVCHISINIFKKHHLSL